MFLLKECLAFGVEFVLFFEGDLLTLLLQGPFQKQVVVVFDGQQWLIGLVHSNIYITQYNFIKNFMDGNSLFSKFLQCCQKPSTVSQLSNRTSTKKFSLRSVSKPIKCQAGQKISLKNISANKGNQPYPENTNQMNPSYYGQSSAVIPSSPKLAKNLPVKPSSLRVEATFKNQSFRRNDKREARATVFMHHSPSFNDPKKYHLNSPRGTKIIFQNSKPIKDEGGENGKQSELEGQKTRERSAQASMIRDQKGEKGSKFSSISFYERRLGQSKNTVISQEKNDEESKIKVQESMIMIDYFNPKHSQLERWLHKK